jgi:hypothetical protein
MMLDLKSQISHFRLHPSRRGYSFPEVMFAVVVLGIGFIMLAAIFPVALSQSKLTNDETRASQIAQGAVTYLQSIAMDPTPLPVEDPLEIARYVRRCIFPATGMAAGTQWPGTVSAFTNLPVQSPPQPGSDPDPQPAWNAVRLRQIDSNDPRFAWVALYRRDGHPNPDTLAELSTWSKTVQIYVIPVQVRTRTTYSNQTSPDDIASLLRDDAYLSYPGLARMSRSNLFPRQVRVMVEELPAPDNKPNHIWFTGESKLRGAAAEGAYVIMQQSGRIYRLGNRVAEKDDNTRGQAWELQPGNDIANPAAENFIVSPGLNAYLIGRESKWDVPVQSSPIAPDQNPKFEGPAQDVGIYTTFISIK